MTKPLRCLLVDDELPALDEPTFLLSGFDDVEIAGTARSAGQALAEIARLRPDVVFQDIQMPGGTGFSVLERLSASPRGSSPAGTASLSTSAGSAPCRVGPCASWSKQP